MDNIDESIIECDDELHDETVGAEQFAEPVKDKGRGSPKGKRRSRLKILTEGQTAPESPRHPKSSPNSTSWSPRSNPGDGPTLPYSAESSSSSSRPSFYLLGKTPPALSMSKIPKAGPVLGRLLQNLQNHSLLDASKVVGQEVKEVWKHHFGSRFILGKELGKESEDLIDEKIKIIKSDRHVAEKVVELYKRWKSLEKESRRPDRALKNSFVVKQQNFISDLELPFDIRKVDAETTIQQSGTIYWREEVMYLKNQMTKEQPRSVGGFDTRQKKRDLRVLKEESRKVSSNVEKVDTTDNENEKQGEVLDENENDENFEVKKS